MKLNTIFEYSTNDEYSVGEIITLNDISFEIIGSMSEKTTNIYHLAPKYIGDKITDDLIKNGYLDDVVNTYVSAFNKFPVFEDNKLSTERNDYIKDNLDQLSIQYSLFKK